MNDPKRPSLREAARRGALANRRSQAVQPPTAPASTAATAAPPGRGAKPSPPVAGVEQVAALCGHVVPFERFEDGKDKHRDARRKKLTDAPCPDCRRRAHEERTAAEQEAARKRRQEVQARPKKARPPERLPGRLPDGSRFDVIWDANKGEWSGTLAVPGLDPFAGSASAVFKLLQLLDGMYRATASAEPPPDAAADKEEGT